MDNSQKIIDSVVSQLYRDLHNSQKIIDSVVSCVLVNSSYGQYLPQQLAELISNGWPEALKAVQAQCPKDTLAILLEGPGHAEYCEAFTEIEPVTIQMNIGSGLRSYGLHCNQDLFLIDLTVLESLTDQDQELFWENFDS